MIGWIVWVLLLGFFAAGWAALNIAHIPPHPQLTIVMFWTHWLLTIGACVPVLLWSFSPTGRRFWPGVVLSFCALASGCWGLTCIRIVTTAQTNGRVRCVFDSRWYFTASVLLAALAFAAVLFQRWRLRPRPVIRDLVS